MRDQSIARVNRPVFARPNREFRNGARDWIAAGIQAGDIDAAIDPDTEAAVIVAMLRGVALQWLTEPGCVDLEAARHAIKGHIRGRLS